MQPLFSKSYKPLRTVILQALRSVAKVSYLRVGFHSVFFVSGRLSTSLVGVQCYVHRWRPHRRRPSSGGACLPFKPHVQPTDRPYQRPWSGAQRGCTGSDCARGIFLDLSYGEYCVDCPSVSPEGTLTLGDENHPRGRVCYSSV